MKVIQQLSENQFVIELDDSDAERNKPRKLHIQHDYIEFEGGDVISSDLHNLTGKFTHGCNNIYIPVGVQVPIKAMQEVILPILNKHKYLQPNHLAAREYTEDDTYWNAPFNKDKGYTKPRWKKGDLYPAYAYYNQIIQYWEDNVQMVAFLKEGDWKFNHVTLEFFNEYVKPKL